MSRTRLAKIFLVYFLFRRQRERENSPIPSCLPACPPFTHTPVNDTAALQKKNLAATSVSPVVLTVSLHCRSTVYDRSVRIWFLLVRFVPVGTEVEEL